MINIEKINFGFDTINDKGLVVPNAYRMSDDIDILNNVVYDGYYQDSDGMSWMTPSEIPYRSIIDEISLNFTTEILIAHHNAHHNVSLKRVYMNHSSDYLDRGLNWIHCITIHCYVGFPDFSHVVSNLDSILSIETKIGLRNKFCKLFISFELESIDFYERDIINLHNFCKRNKINPSQIYITSFNYGYKKKYDDLCVKNNIFEKINIFNIPHVTHSAIEGDDTPLPGMQSKHQHHKVTLQEFLSTKNKIRNKHFVSYNAQCKNHRIELVDFIKKNNLLERGFVSLLFPNDETEPLRIKEELINPKIPYLDSYFNITSESEFFDPEGVSTFLTEKTWKPFANFQPAIFMGSRHTLELLKDIGFKTFHPFIDETYDGESDKNRLELIKKEVFRLSSMTIADIHEWYWQMEDILLWNEECYRQMPSEYDFWETVLIELYHE